MHCGIHDKLTITPALENNSVTTASTPVVILCFIVCREHCQLDTGFFLYKECMVNLDGVPR
jgi:hypothetical protein